MPAARKHPDKNQANYLCYNIFMKNNGGKKILIFRPGAIGDVVMTTVIAKAIKEKYPNYVIHYLTQTNISPILENNPYIDKIIVLKRKDRKSISYIFNLIKTIFCERYDVIFNLTNSVRNILISILSVPKKIVFRKDYGGPWVEDYFLTAKKIFPEIELPKNLTLGVNKTDLEKITNQLKNYPKPHIMIIPGGATDKNRQGRIWNIKKWAELNKNLQNKYGGTIFVVGSKGERETHEQLKDSNIIVTSGEYTLSESSALLSKSDLVISSDTGTVHIASAHNIPAISLLGSTSPDKIKPYGDKSFYISADTDCKFCWKKKCKHLKEGEKYTPCMENISPETVMDKIAKENLL